MLNFILKHSSRAEGPGGPGLVRAGAGRPEPWRRPGRNGRGGSPAGSRSRSWRAWRRAKVRRRPAPPPAGPRPGAAPCRREGGWCSRRLQLCTGAAGLGARGGGSQARPGGRRASCEAPQSPSSRYPTARPWPSRSMTDWGGVQGVPTLKGSGECPPPPPLAGGGRSCLAWTASGAS